MMPVDDLLPQSEPMVLLSGYEPSAERDTVEAFVDISPSSPFFERAIGGVPSCVALEYMAQTMALLVGLMRRERGEPPQLGFVLGSRKLDILMPKFESGKRYRITASCNYQDNEFGSFDCKIVNPEGTVVACGTLTAFQPSGEATLENLKEYA